jgi:signal transduction histidine kinase
MGMEDGIFTESGKLGFIIIGGVLLMFFMAVTLLLFFYFSKKKIIQKELEKKNIELQHNKELFQATLEVQEKERKRIAQDLHDEISSKLNVVSLNCHFLTMDNIEKEKQAEIIDTIIDLSGKALENSRRIAHNLFPPVFDKLGLNSGVEELCKEFNTLNNVAVNYESKIIFDDASKERHIHVFRIIQELLNNSVRHGKASTINILFDIVDGLNTCVYNDNGIGFTTDSPDYKNGLGMNNIESRIGFLKGSLHIDSKVNRGTNVIFSF